MLHSLVTLWFNWVEHWGYFGVFILMAMESSIVPVPSEIVMPPAAYWAAQGRMDLGGVILAGTLGSYVGSALSYWVAQWLGLPVVRKYGRYFLLSTDKVQMAEAFVRRYGNSGIFFARFLPVVRHLISIPAGVFRMPFVPFSLVTTVGAGLWCAILAVFGQKVLGAHPELLNSPVEMIAAIKSQLHYFVAGVLVLGALYGWVLYFKSKSQKSITPVASLS